MREGTTGEGEVLLLSGWQVGVGADLHNLSTGDDGISVFPGTQINGPRGALGLGHAPFFPSSRGLRLGFLGFRWLRSPHSSQVAMLGAAVAAGPWVWAMVGERWSLGRLCGQTLRLSLVEVQAGGCSLFFWATVSAKWSRFHCRSSWGGGVS